MQATLLALALFLGTTSQEAFSRCGETHLTVRNNTAEPVHAIMFGEYRLIEPSGSVVFWTDEPVAVDRVTRRREGQVYHTSVTSRFSTEERPCILEWATL